MTHSPLWELTWKRVNQFLPNLKEELFDKEPSNFQRFFSIIFLNLKYYFSRKINTIILISVLLNRGQLESGSKSQVVSPSSPPPNQNLQSPPPISNPNPIQPLMNPNQFVNIAVQQQSQPPPSLPQQQHFSAQSIPISSIILEPPQNTLVHPNISLVSGFEGQAQPQVKHTRF